MYSYNNKTEAISARLALGLKDRIDFECAQHKRMNRNSLTTRPHRKNVAMGSSYTRYSDEGGEQH